MRRIALIGATVAALAAMTPATAGAHVHGITPLLTLANECGVTKVENTGANRAQGAPITGLIPVDVGSVFAPSPQSGRLRDGLLQAAKPLTD